MPITSPGQQIAPTCETCGNRPGTVRDTPLRTAVCGPCWAVHGGEASAAEIGPAPLLAIPSREAVTEREWFELLTRESWFEKLRSDARRRLRQLITCLRNWADWSELTTRPTWPELCAASEWARSTMAGWLRQLRLLGWLVVVEPGSTPEHRPMGSPEAVEGNRAAVYGLTIPITADQQHQARQDAKISPTNDGTSAQVNAPVIKTWTPSWSFRSVKEGFVGGSTRARDFFHSPGTPPPVLLETTNEALRARLDENERGFQWSDQVPTTKAQMYAAACELRRQHPILARLSPRAIRSIARSYWVAGWSNADVLRGLEYRPTSWRAPLPSPAAYGVIHPLAWSRSRLAAWRDERGRVLPGLHRVEADRGILRARFGRAGARLLTRNPAKPLVQAVAEHGRRCARQLAEDHTGPDRQCETTPIADAETRAAARARFAAERQRQLIERAKAFVAKNSTTKQCATPATPVTSKESTTTYERAQEQLRRSGRLSSRFGRRRPRW